MDKLYRDRVEVPLRYILEGRRRMHCSPPHVMKEERGLQLEEAVAGIIQLLGNFGWRAVEVSGDALLSVVWE